MELKENSEEKKYTEEEVEKLLSTQKGNCYVAILSETNDPTLAKIALLAPLPFEFNQK